MPYFRRWICRINLAYKKLKSVDLTAGFMCVRRISLSLSFVLISIKAIERDLKKMKFSSLFIFALFAVAFVSASCSSQRITAWQPSPVNPEIKPFSTEELVVVPQVVWLITYLNR